MQVWSNFQQCFAPEFRRVTLMMMAVWFTMSFRWQRGHPAGLRGDWEHWEGTGTGLGALGGDWDGMASPGRDW